MLLGHTHSVIEVSVQMVTVAIYFYFQNGLFDFVLCCKVIYRYKYAFHKEVIGDY